MLRLRICCCICVPPHFETKGYTYDIRGYSTKRYVTPTVLQACVVRAFTTGELHSRFELGGGGRISWDVSIASIVLCICLVSSDPQQRDKDCCALTGGQTPPTRIGAASGDPHFGEKNVYSSTAVALSRIFSPARPPDFRQRSSAHRDTLTPLLPHT